MVERILAGIRRCKELLDKNEVWPAPRNVQSGPFEVEQVTKLPDDVLKAEVQLRRHPVVSFVQMRKQTKTGGLQIYMQSHVPGYGPRVKLADQFEAALAEVGYRVESKAKTTSLISTVTHTITKGKQKVGEIVEVAGMNLLDFSLDYDHHERILRTLFGTQRLPVTSAKQLEAPKQSTLRRLVEAARRRIGSKQ